MEICRAYWKLQEAFERYRDGMTKLDSSAVLLPPNCFITDEKNQLVGLDVGASPGGWTQFLIDECCCQTVYSIDPGALHQDLLNRTKKHVVKGENENDEVSVDNFFQQKSRDNALFNTCRPSFKRLCLLLPGNEMESLSITMLATCA